MKKGQKTYPSKSNTFLKKLQYFYIYKAKSITILISNKKVIVSCTVSDIKLNLRLNTRLKI